MSGDRSRAAPATRPWCHRARGDSRRSLRVNVGLSFPKTVGVKFPTLYLRGDQPFSGSGELLRGRPGRRRGVSADAGCRDDGRLRRWSGSKSACSRRR